MVMPLSYLDSLRVPVPVYIIQYKGMQGKWESRKQTETGMSAGMGVRVEAGMETDCATAHSTTIRRLATLNLLLARPYGAHPLRNS